MKLSRLLVAAAVALPACTALAVPAAAADDPWIDGAVKVDMPATVTVKGGWAAGSLTLSNPTDKPLTGQRVKWEVGGLEYSDPLPTGSLLMDWADGPTDSWHRVSWSYEYPNIKGALYWWMGPAGGMTLAPHSTHTYRLRVSLPQSTMQEPITDLGFGAILGSGKDDQNNPVVWTSRGGDSVKVRGLSAKLKGVPSQIAVDGTAHGFTLDMTTLNKADWKLQQAGFGVDPGDFAHPVSSCNARIELRDPVTGAWNTAPMNAWTVGSRTVDLRRWASGPVDHRVVTARLLLGGGFTAGRHTVGAGHYPGAGPNNFFPMVSFTAVRTTAKPSCLKLYTTTISGFNASPEPVRKGAVLTTTGVLKAKFGSTWKTLSGRSVSVFFRAKGSTRWVNGGSAVTDAKGRFTKRFTARQDGTWTAAFTGTTTLHSSIAAGDYVDVR